jgi:hypothetical protein
MRRNITVRELVSMVDTRMLDEVATLTDVNFQVKKLSGQVIFKLLLLAILDDTKVSLRIMEDLFSTMRFKVFAKTNNDESTRFNSISDRLSRIDASFFATIFEQTFSLCQSQFGKNAPDGLGLRLFDSTVISASAKLLKHGMINGLADKSGEHGIRQIKFTIGLQEGMPQKILLFNEQQHLGEDVTLREILLQSAFEPNEVAVFDRGLKKRKTFQELKDKGILFVTRINPSKNIEVIKEFSVVPGTQTNSLQIHSDQLVYLYHEKKVKLKEPFRLVKAASLQRDETLWFLTNIEENIPAATITEIYKQRWAIEVFFKFIKQHLHLKHFLSYTENGIKVIMYMSMIAAILLLNYKKKNELNGYKRVKYRFVEELDSEIVREIVLICGGDPGKSPLFSSA